MKIKEVFDVKQGIQITEEAIYNDIGDIPVVTGRNEIKGYVSSSYITKDELPCITYPTKANIGNCYIQDELFNVNNTACLVLKDEFKDKVCLYWFKHKLGNMLLKNQTSKDSVSYINKNFIEEHDVNIPTPEEQKRELDIYTKLEKYKNNLLKLNKNIERLLNKELKSFSNNGNNRTLNAFLKFVGRNDSLSQEGIYRQLNNLKEERLTILSGSFNNIYGYYPFDNNIKYVKDRPCLQIITRGNAGEVKFLEKGNYATNTNSNLLILKKEKIKELNINTIEEEEIYLKFLSVFLQYKFKQKISSSDLSVLPLSEIINTESIIFPLLCDSMIKVVKIYDRLIFLRNKITENLDKIDTLMKKNIV